MLPCAAHSDSSRVSVCSIYETYKAFLCDPNLRVFRDVTLLTEAHIAIIILGCGSIEPSTIIVRLESQRLPSLQQLIAPLPGCIESPTAPSSTVSARVSSRLGAILMPGWTLCRVGHGDA